MNYYDIKQILIYILFALILAIITAIVIYCEWSRKKMLKPIRELNKKDKIKYKDRLRLIEFINALRELAQSDKKVAEVLKSFSLM